jgi:prepilin-type N-terminal cleavage/methylation domain-containing protein
MNADQRLHHNRRRQARHATRGVTLLELLVVITIMVLLAAAAVPVFAPAMQNRQIREASRIVSTFFTGARNRAMQSGRPVGVVLERLSGMNDACVSLSYAEVPSPYSGDASNSTALVQYYVVNGSNQPFLAALTPISVGGLSADVGWMGTVRVGDMVRFNFQGPYFQILTPLNPVAWDPTTGFLLLDPATPPPPGQPAYSNMWPLGIVSGTNTVPPNGGGGTTGFRYQIVRAPMRMAAGALQLPGPTVIDLSFSGFNGGTNLVDTNNNHNAANNTNISPWVYSYSFQPLWPRVGVTSLATSNCPFTTVRDDTSSVIITFNPSGGVDWVWSWPNGYSSLTDAAMMTLQLPTAPQTNPIPAPVKPTTPIHLLVGRRELLPLPASPPPITSPNDPKFQPYANWQDLTNFWVTINPQSGQVTVVENAASTTAINNNGYLNNGFGSFVELMEARQLALQSMRARGQ